MDILSVFIDYMILRITIFPYECEAQLEHLASIAVCMAWAEAGQELWRHTSS